MRTLKQVGRKLKVNDNKSPIDRKFRLDNK
jgi:hypothetical protein